MLSLGSAAQPNSSTPLDCERFTTTSKFSPSPKSSLSQFRAWVQVVWDLDQWRRGQPKPSTLAAYRRKLRCAGPENRAAMKHRWRKRKHAYYQHRRAELWRSRVTPFWGCTGMGCHFYAIPAYIVDCESGGRYNDPSAPNGAYSMLTGPLQGVPTWESWRPSWASGYAAPYEAPPKAQDIAAHRLWQAYGSEPWTCA